MKHSALSTLHLQTITMALAAFGVAWRSHLAPNHALPVPCLRKVRRFSKFAAAVELPVADSPIARETDRKNDSPVKDRKEEPEWKKLSSKELGIKMSFISKPTKMVLIGLRKKGYEVYLVGGCVRDLILKRTPKDFDIVTSAELKEVKKTFPRCEIVGKRFPICHVHVNDATVEVCRPSLLVKITFIGIICLKWVGNLVLMLSSF